MAIVQPNTGSQPFGLTQACIKGLTDDDGLGDLVRNHTTQRHYDKREIVTVGENKFGELLRKYELYAESRAGVIYKSYNLSDLVKEVLTPIEINYFLQLTNTFYDYRHMDGSVIYGFVTGPFISKLIQNSYEAGYNNFVLNTKDLIDSNIHLIGYNIKGKPDRICYIQIDGDIGSQCGVSAEYASFIINGNSRDKFEGAWAKNCCFILNGDFNPDGIAYRASSCTIKTTNKKVLDKLLREVPLICGHSIYFINADGSEEAVSTLKWAAKRAEYRIEMEIRVKKSKIRYKSSNIYRKLKWRIWKMRKIGWI